MSFIKSFYQNKITKSLLVVLVPGIVLILWPFVFPAKECPDKDIFGNCIIGANIGGALMVFAGILISVVATVGLFGELLTSLPSHRNRVISYTTSLVVVIGFLLILIGVIGAPLNNRTELEKLNNCVTKDFATGANLYLYNSTNPTMNKYCSNLKGAPGAKINYTNPKVFSGTVLFLAGIFGVAKIIKPRKN